MKKVKKEIKKIKAQQLAGVKPPLKVLVIITASFEETQQGCFADCLKSAISQDYKNFTVMIHLKKPIVDQSMDHKMVYFNCTDNMNEARKIALNSDAEKFLFVDSDILLPPGAISELVKQNKDIIGGWYQLKDVEGNLTNVWSCGSWGGDNLFVHRMAVGPSVIKVDMVGHGCMMVSKKVLKQIPFRHGLDMTCNFAVMGNKKGQLGACAVFGNDADEKGFALYMSGDVVCTHMEREVLV